MGRMRVLLADDHPKVRWALRTFIREKPNLTVVGDVSDANDLLVQALALQPDLILLEWELSDWAAGKLLSELRRLDLAARVVVLSWQPGSEQDALDAGADCFVNKASGPQELLSALDRCMGR
jgi:DNA-binding NarL/FixJ family response regulator